MSYNDLFGLGSHSVDAGVLANWLMQETSGTSIADRSGNTQTGTTAGTPTLGAVGPAWLANAISWNGSSQDMSFPSDVGTFTNSSSYTIIGWIKPVVTNKTGWIFCNSTLAARAWSLRQVGDGTNVKFRYGASQSDTHAVDSNTTTSTDWMSLIVTVDAGVITFYRNGASFGGGTQGVADNRVGNSNLRFASRLGAAYLEASTAEWALVNRVLTSGEIADVYAGPEPLNTVAPAAPTGTQTEGQILTALTGTWDSQSNGTITYGYQWTRSNDGAGAGEADIGGATASTYTLVAGDVGKFIRCRVRGTNDGGFDSAEDTPSAFAGAIASSGSTYTLTCDVGSFALTGIDAGLLAGRRLTADLGTFALTGIDAGILARRLLTADAGSFALTGIDANLLANRLLSADVGEFVLTGINVDLTYSGAGGPTYTLTCDVGSFTLTGIDTGLLASRRITADVGSFALTGIDAAVLANRLITADAGAFTLTGIDAAFVVNRRLAADTGAFVLTGIDANLTYSGATSSSASIYYYLMMGS